MTQRTQALWTWRSTTAVAGLAVGIVGILLQYLGDRALFGGFPPGIYFLAGAGVLVVLTRSWRWAPIFAVVLAAFVTFGGIAGGQLGKNITSGDVLVSAGAVILQIGLAASIVAGILAIVHNRTSRRPRADVATGERPPVRHG